MKKTITSIITVLIMTISLSSFAKEKINPLRTKDATEILNNYVAATSEGIIDLNNYLFTDDFEYINITNNNSVGKKEYLKFLKQNKGLSYNCETSSEILDKTNNTVVAKIAMKFESFTKINHITMIHSKDGWKIKSITSSYI